MEDFLIKNQKLLIFLLIGLILIGFGVLLFKTNIFTQSDSVEILQSTTEPQNADQEIVVEISGAVEKEGVYEFQSFAYKTKNGPRVDDLLIAAGGLSVNADRDFVTKKINRAAKLIDGQKIYIYQKGELSAKELQGIKVDQAVLGDSGSNLVNINTASLSELDKLSGIGPVYAQKIIDNRSYSTLEELVSKGVIGQSLFDKIKNDISLY